jgi:hypothetical protein
MRPRLEILETRCLMSALFDSHSSSGSVPKPAADQVRMQRPNDDSRYPSVTSRDAAAATVPIDPVHASYVIVPETTAPHSTLATAQVLPDLPFFGVVGNLGPTGSIDLYQLTIDATTAGVQFELVAQQPPGSTPVQLSLYDATGRVLGTWGAGAQAQGDASSFSLEFPSQSLSAVLYLGVALPSSQSSGPTGSSSVVAYQLWVSRLAGPDRASAAGAGAGTAVVPAPAASVILGPSPGTTPIAPGAPAQPPASASTVLGVAQGPALSGGSLPTRAFGPSGGVLAGGDTTRTVRRLSVTWNRDRDAPVPPAMVLESGLAAEPRAEPGLEADPGALVAIRGPGGFPLLGAAAIGNWRRSPRRVVAAADTSAAVNTANDPARPATSQESRAPLSFGLSLATLVTLNLVLSDPVAGFDYLATRLDPEASDRAKTAAKVRRT